MSKRLVQSAAVTRAVALCLVVLQLIVSIGLSVGFGVVAADVGAPSAVVAALFALGVVIGLLNAWFDIRHPDHSYALRWLRRGRSEPGSE